MIRTLCGSGYSGLMTDIHTTELDLFKRAEIALHSQLDAILLSVGKEDSPPDSTSTEKWAKSISTLLKALDDAAQRRAAAEAEIAAKTYTRYEDMPPPTPEDEARFYDEFRKLVGEVTHASPEG